MEEPYISGKQLVKAYRIDTHELVALRGIDYEQMEGEFVAIIGPSGAGKSTLLNLLGGLDTPTAGRLKVGGLDLLSLRASALADYRLKRVGFVWQQVDRNLLPHRSALRNVTLPMMLAGVAPWKRAPRAKELLEAVGLGEQIYKRPMSMSGGQQQRVAIAVALANNPPLLLADEPTGALDRKTAKQVMQLLQQLRQRYNLTVLMVTHDLDIADYADRVLTLRDGALAQDLTHTGEEAPALDEAGRIKLPTEVRNQLSGAPRIAVEIRPEGVLLRPDLDANDDASAALQEILPQDAPPERRGLLARLFRRNKIETRKAS
jgi:ABC-type lipoprotein export system ATPase subunit